ncbi:MAG: hypothetical protein ACRDB2_04415, partial [Fusobacteriaceae bacterium]
MKLSIPQAPFVIGFVLGGMTETNFRRALMLGDSDYTVFLTNPISGLFIGITILFIGSILIKNIKSNKKEECSIYE